MVLLTDATVGRINGSSYSAEQHVTSLGSYQSRPSTLNLAAPTFRARRITKKFLQRHMFWSGTFYRRLHRWDRGWCLYENPLYADDDDDDDDVMQDCCNNNLTSSKSTDSGCALDFDDLCAGMYSIRVLF